MNTDTLSLIFKSSADTVKNSVKTMIGLFQQYSNTLDKTKKSMQDVANATNTTDGNFNKSKQRIQEISAKYKRLSSIIKKYSPEMGFRHDFRQYTQYSPDVLKSATAGSVAERDALISKTRSDEDESRLSTLSKDITDATQAMRFLKETGGQSYDEIVSKAQEYKRQLDEINAKQRELSNAKLPNVENTGKQYVKLNSDVKNTTNSVNRLSSSMRGLGSISKSIGSKGFDFLKNKFKDFTKSFGKSVDGNIKEIKKFALGLVGVRTAMSVLTKSVNAYLSFDSELQDSLTNSWNMLGSLLAPAIELVANLFAIATNYVAQFVNALTGINLVARANAKALQTQAKSMKGVSEAQRGLLSMDEITNLPTEPGGTSGGGDVAQIKMEPIDTKGIFSDLLKAFKKHKWHRAGEIIAEGINTGLNSINWAVAQKNAENMGRNISTFLNGVFELDWHLLGSSLANAINLAIDFAYGFVDTFEWGRLGAGIGNAITSFFNTFDFSKLADSINKFVEGIIGMVRTALIYTDEKGLAETIVKFIERIDWMGIMSRLVSLLITFIGKAISFRLTALETIINDLQNFFIGKIQNLGNISGKKLAESFSKAFKRVFNIFINAINTTILPMRSIITALGKITGHNVNLKDIRIPSLDVGTPNIETEGLYHLHEGEMVVPKRYNPNTDGYNNSSDNRQIIDLLVSLNSSMLEYANRPINIGMNGRKVAEGIYDDMQQIDKNRNKSTAVVRS